MELFKVEWCSVGNNSFWGVWFGHGLKSQPIHAIVAHLKKGTCTSKRGDSKSSRRRQMSILVFLQTYTYHSHFSDYHTLQARLQIEKFSECCGILNEYFQSLSCLALTCA